jgi:hypothetical protein
MWGVSDVDPARDNAITGDLDAATFMQTSRRLFRGRMQRPNAPAVTQCPGSSLHYVCANVKKCFGFVTDSGKILKALKK